MKTNLTTSLLLLLALGLRPALAAAHDPENAAPSRGQLAGGGIAARPLVRYLAATLHLSRAQAAAVQQAVAKHQRRVRTPNQLAQCMAEVLTPNELDRFLQLQDRPDTFGMLQYLALQ